MEKRNLKSRKVAKESNELKDDTSDAAFGRSSDELSMKSSVKQQWQPTNSTRYKVNNSALVATKYKCILIVIIGMYLIVWSVLWCKIKNLTKVLFAWFV